MVQNNLNHFDFYKSLEISNFRQSLPWLGGDLQTIRDTFCIDLNKSNNSRKVFIPVKKFCPDEFKGDYLLGFLDIPKIGVDFKGFAIVTHGLGGSTQRYGLKRISRLLLKDGLAVLKLNLRGAGSGRYLSDDNYSARCSNDIISVVNYLRNNFRKLLKEINLKDEIPPIFGVGLSLGGTILLNACFDYQSNKENILLDGLACVSSPLDLLLCSQCIEKSRNYFYQKWLINRLKKQVLQSNLNLKKYQSQISFRKSLKKIHTIREFDKNFTAPSWGYYSVENYYSKASPVHRMKGNIQKLPKTLLIHAKDDPWVPYETTQEMKKCLEGNKSQIYILITKNGGHNGFHSPNGCWSDNVVKCWFNSICSF